jgi:hypothetical protein
MFQFTLHYPHGSQPCDGTRKSIRIHPKNGLSRKDYTRIDNFSFDDCHRSCANDVNCNAFTYNQLNDVCFLKSNANQWVSFYAWAITGIKVTPCD